jgi:hypothetical protein
MNILFPLPTKTPKQKNEFVENICLKANYLHQLSTKHFEVRWKFKLASENQHQLTVKEEAFISFAHASYRRRTSGHRKQAKVAQATLPPLTQLRTIKFSQTRLHPEPKLEVNL